MKFFPCHFGQCKTSPSSIALHEVIFVHCLLSAAALFVAVVAGVIHRKLHTISLQFCRLSLLSDRSNGSNETSLSLSLFRYVFVVHNVRLSFVIEKYFFVFVSLFLT